MKSVCGQCLLGTMLQCASAEHTCISHLYVHGLPNSTQDSIKFLYYTLTTYFPSS